MLFLVMGLFSSAKDMTKRKVKVLKKGMATTVQIVHSGKCQQVCQYNQYAEFLRSCGVFVYESEVDSLLRNSVERIRGIERTICLNDGTEYRQNAGDGFGDSKETIVEFIVQLSVAEQEKEELVRYYDRFMEEELYLYIYVIRNLKEVQGLINDSKQKLSKMLEFFENQDFQSERLKFANIYLWKSYLDVSSNMKENPDKQYIFGKIMEKCDSIGENSDLKEAVYELKGDIYHDWGFNNVMGIMYYEACVNDYDYIVCGKLAEYWGEVIKSGKGQEKYIEKLLECKDDSCLAKVKWAYMLEGKEEKKQALEIYQQVLDGLAGKVRDRFLLPEEFYSLCQAHKRMGCILYKNEADPRYDAAVEHYHTIFRIWNDCENNHFLDCFHKKYREDIVGQYKRSFHIRGVVASLAKIYDLMGEKEKEKRCNNLFKGKWEELQMISTEL